MSREFVSICTDNKLEQAKSLWEKGGIDLSFEYAGNTALLIASHKGHTEMVEWLIEIGSPLEAESMDKKTALIRAAFSGHTAIVKLLMNAGADIHAKDKKGKSALDYASERRATDIIALFGSPNAAPPESPSESRNDSSTEVEKPPATPVVIVPSVPPASIEADPKISKTFHGLCQNNKLDEAKALWTQGGVDPDFVYVGYTALMQSAKNGHTDVAKWLIEIGASVDFVGSDNKTALIIASLYGHIGVVEALLNASADVNATDKDQHTPILIALANVKSPIRENIVTLLLAKGANPNLRNKTGKNALDYVFHYRLDIAETLLEAGLNINEVNDQGDTALINAIANKQEAAAISIIKRGADIHHMDKDGQTALHHAAKNALTEVATLLVEGGIDIDIADAQNKTAYEYANRYSAAKAIAEMLAPPPTEEELAAVAEKERLAAEKAAATQAAAAAKELKHALGNADNLAKAIQNGNVFATRYYLEQGEDINQIVNYPPYQGYTLFGLAIRRDKIEVAKILIDAGIDIHAKLNSSFLVDFIDYMEMAIRHKAADFATLLAELGFDLNRQDYLSILVKYCSGADHLPKFNVMYPLFKDATATYDVPTIIRKMNDHYETIPPEYFADIIKNVTDINQQDSKGKTLLHHALERFNTQWIDVLLEREDIDINIPDSEDYTPLYYACVHATDGIVKRLMLMGADINALCGPESAPVAMGIFRNKREGILDVLCAFGADVITADDEGFTMLHAACETENLNQCRMLLAHGADPTTADRDGNTPLHRLVGVESYVGSSYSFRSIIDAAIPVEDSIQIANLLVEKGANTDAINHYGQTPFFSAFVEKPITVKKTEFALVKHLVTLGALVDTQDNANNTCLHFAVASGDINHIKFLLENGADSNVQNGQNFSPYQLAVQENKRSIISLMEKASVAIAMDGTDMDAAFMNACKNGRRGVAEMLVKNGNIDTTYVDDMGRTPLHYIARMGSAALAKFAMDNGVDVNYTDNDNRTALHFAAGSKNNDVFKLLLENGANPNIADDRGVLPIHLVANRGQHEILSLLLSHNADTEALTNEGASLLHMACYTRSKECVRLLLEAGINPDVPDKFGIVPMIVSVSNNQKEIVNMLLSVNANVSAKDQDGDESIHIAAIHGYKDMALLLLEKGSNVNVMNNRGLTPLHLAAYCGNKDIFKVLLDNGADYDIKTSAGKSCIDIAAENGQKELIELIGIAQMKRK